MRSVLNRGVSEPTGSFGRLAKPAGGGSRARCISSRLRSFRSCRWLPLGCRTRKSRSGSIFRAAPIESHLYRVYPKIGVTSRAQLQDVLGNEIDTGLCDPAAGARVLRDEP